MSALKKLFIITVLLFIPTTSVAALSIPTTDPGEDITANNYKAPQNSDYTLLNLFSSIGCQTGGVSFIPNQKCLGYSKDGPPKLWTRLPDGGVLGGVNNVMLTMYTTPPTSTTLYLADVGSNLGLIKPVYAAGISGQGNDVLQPILKMWEIMRNLSYAVFILVFLAVGFMIMFRQKISQQAVVSIQQALPGLVIGLILVTFSYLISAFIVDLSFLGMGVVAALFEPIKANVIKDPNQIVNQNINLFQLIGYFSYGNLGTLFNKVIAPLAKDAFNPIAQINTAPTGIFNPIATLYKYESAAFFGAVGGVVGILLSLIIIIALLIQMFRLLWALISAYITILVITILSPLIILASTVPGKSNILSVWWKTLLGNVLIFPAIFATFLFAGTFLGYANPDDFATAKVLPLLSFPSNLVPAIIGYGIILGSPAIPKMVKDALGVKEPQGIPQEAIGGAMAGVGMGATMATQGYSRAWRGGAKAGMPAEGVIPRTWNRISGGRFRTSSS